MKKKLIKFYRSFINDHPKIGDKVETIIGFGTVVRGIVTSVYDDYCWIDNDIIGNPCTASFSYCSFKYL